MKNRLVLFVVLAVLLACGVLGYMLAASLRNFTDVITPTCQAVLSPEQIEQQRQRILVTPVIKRLLQEAGNLQFHLSDCAYAGTFQGYLDFNLPASYSQFGVVYRPIIDFNLSSDNLDYLTLSWHYQPLALDYQAITGELHRKINEYESAPEIQEYLGREKPVPTLIEPNQIRYYTENISSELVYSSEEHRVLKYYLPNAIHWESFPQIEQAHQIIRQNLLQGSLASCQVEMEGLFGFTSGQTIYAKDAYHLEVGLRCPDKVREAGLDLYPDGHFENLQIVWEGG